MIVPEGVLETAKADRTKAQQGDGNDARYMMVHQTGRMAEKRTHKGHALVRIRERSVGLTWPAEPTTSCHTA